MTEITKEEIKNFLSIGRTPKEIEEILKLNENDFLNAVKEISDCDLFAHRLNDNQSLYVLAERTVIKEKKSKIWQYRIQPKGQPYLWIQFPNDIKWDRIIIIPLSDIHYGSQNCDEKLLNKRILEIGAKENAFAILMGDETENALPDSPGGAIFEQKIRPREQIVKFEQKIQSIAHKILWAIPGNHESRSIKRCDLDPLFFICRNFGIPYFDEPVFVNILWKGYVFTFYCQHGSTNAQTEGGKINMAGRPLKFIDFTMFIVMAHVHDKTTNKVIRICREREMDKEANIVKLDLVEKKQYVVICPSFYKYFGSYAAKKPYLPTSRTKVVMTIFANGDYHVPG